MIDGRIRQKFVQIIQDNIQQLGDSINNCDPDAPVLSIRTALAISDTFRMGFINRNDSDQLVDRLLKTVELFRDNCACAVPVIKAEPLPLILAR